MFNQQFIGHFRGMAQCNLTSGTDDDIMPLIEGRKEGMKQKETKKRALPQAAARACTCIRYILYIHRVYTFIREVPDIAGKLCAGNVKRSLQRSRGVRKRMCPVVIMLYIHSERLPLHSHEPAVCVCIYICIYSGLRSACMPTRKCR